MLSISINVGWASRRDVRTSCFWLYSPIQGLLGGGGGGGTMRQWITYLIMVDNGGGYQVHVGGLDPAGIMNDLSWSSQGGWQLDTRLGF